MNKDEFLRRLEEALAGEVPANVVRDNLNYYEDYLTGELKKGRTMDEIIGEIGEPNIVAKTIIESAETVGEAYSGASGSYREEKSGESSYRQESYEREPIPGIHYIDLNKWYWKLIFAVILFVVLSLVFSILGGVMYLAIRYSGLIMICLLVYWAFKNWRR